MYGLTVSATFGGGNVQAGSTSETTFTANGFVKPPGQYRLAITTATAVYAALTSVPTHFKQEMREYHSHDGEKGGNRIQKNGLATPMPAHSFHRHTLPVRLGCVGCSFQCKKT